MRKEQIRIGFISILLFASLLHGCSGSGGKITIGNIEGPGMVEGNSTVEYKVTAKGATDFTYQWLCSPLHAGQFDPPDSADTKFTIIDFEEDMAIKLQVVVSSSKSGIVVQRRDITVARRPRLGWAKTWGTTSGYNRAVALDDFGNIYLTGSFSNQVDFDPGPGIEERVSTNGSSFLSKYNPDGEFLWVRTWETRAGAIGMAIDSQGNIYIIGLFYGTVDLDPTQGTDYHSSSESPLGETTHDIYLTKFDSNGDFQWARTWGGDWRHNIQFGRGFGLATDNSGYVYVTGPYRGTCDFDPGPGILEYSSCINDSSQLPSKDIFLSKFNTTGELEWAVVWGGEYSDTGYDVITDSKGTVYVAGDFIDTLDFDPGPGVSYESTFYSATYSDTFISVFNSDGIFQRVTTWGDMFDDFAAGLAVDNLDNLYVVGTTSVKEELGLGAYAISFCAFLTKYNTSGDHLWTQTWGKPNPDVYHGGWAEGFGVCTSASSNVYVTGNLVWTVDFDPGPGEVIYTTEEDFLECDAYLSKFNQDGVFQWARAWGGSGYDAGFSVVSDESDNAFVSGYFQSWVDFDPGPGFDKHKAISMFAESNTFLSKFPPGGDW